MGLLSRIFKIEKRAETAVDENSITDKLFLNVLLGNAGNITKEQVLNIPSVQGCINFLSGIVSVLPVKLYKETDGEADEVKLDSRLKLLNDDTGDTLDAVQFWRALIGDYFLGKGGYVYINRYRNGIASLHYVDESFISVNDNADPIFKDYSIMANGKTYKPHDFIKLLRNSKNGAYGESIVKGNNLILSTAYYALKFENTLLKKGGNKRGILSLEEKVTQQVLDEIKKAAQSYSENSNDIMTLNKGAKFQETNDSSDKIQLNENKKTNSAEICKLFGLSENVINGTADAAEYSSAFKTGVVPVLRMIECALNRDLLLEKEKPQYYWAFDTKEMLKGDIEARFKAYEVGLKSNVLQIDEARFMEDLPPLGIDWINLGLNSVLYDPKTKQFYTPNTNKLSGMESLNNTEGETNENRNTE
jgi:HK97 family phage portal protein